MAATADQQTDPEAVVNRWLLDHFLFLALEAFKNDKYSEFCNIRDILEGVLRRPLACTDVTATKIFILQLLSRINDGERLDVSFDSDKSLSPLESALITLNTISQNCEVSPKDIESFSTSLKEMMVMIFIKNEEFDKAKEVLSKHFPKPNVGKKAIFMGLVSQKSKRHHLIENINFLQFKADVVAFCQKVCPLSVPFLHKAAQQLTDKLGERDKEDPKPREQEVEVVNDTVIVERHSFIQKYRLEAAYKALAGGQDARTFTQLEQEVGQEVDRGDVCLPSASSVGVTSRDTHTDVFQRSSVSPIEASTADQRPQRSRAPQKRAGSPSNTPSKQRKNPFTLARLVVEPDSQLASQCTPSQASPAEETPLSGAAPEARDPPSSDMEGSVAPRQTTKKPSRTAQVPVASSDSEEEPPRSASDRVLSIASSGSQSSSLDSEDASSKTPVKRLQKKTDNRDGGNSSAVVITDSTLDSSPNASPHRRAPQTSSTPHKSPGQHQHPSRSKWKELVANAKESKEDWSDEETVFTKTKGSLNTSASSTRRKMWTEAETKKLIEGVRVFGEGNWTKIRSYYAFKNRTNVNLKDRWRTLKKLKMV